MFFMFLTYREIMFKRSLALSIILLALIVLPVLAQDPEPTFTPTPTLTPVPANVQVVTLSSGHEMVIERTITYGEIAMVVAVLVLTVVELLKAFIEIPKGYIR